MWEDQVVPCVDWAKILRERDSDGGDLFGGDESEGTKNTSRNKRPSCRRGSCPTQRARILWNSW